MLLKRFPRQRVKEGREVGNIVTNEDASTIGQERSPSRRRRNAWIVAGAVVLLVVVGSGLLVFSRSSSDTRRPRSDAAMMAEYARQTLKVKNFAYSVNISGPQAAATGEGSVDVGNDSAQVGISGLPNTRQLVMVRGKSTMYLSSLDFLGTRPDGKDWLSMPNDAFDAQWSKNVGVFASVDPISGLDLLNAQCKTLTVRSSTPGVLGGSRVKHFKISATSADLRSCLANRSISSVVRSQFAAALDLQQITIWVAYDNTHMIRQIDLGGNVSPAHPAGTTFNVLNLFSFGGTGIVGAPRASETYPVSTYQQGVGA